MYQVVSAGPEITMEDIGERMKAAGVKWDVTGIGMGIRAGQDPKVVHFFEGQYRRLRHYSQAPNGWEILDLLHLFREVAPEAQQVFNNGPASILWSIQERIGVADETDVKPGKLLVSNEALWPEWPSMTLLMHDRMQRGLSVCSMAIRGSHLRFSRVCEGRKMGEIMWDLMRCWCGWMRPKKRQGRC